MEIGQLPGIVRMLKLAGTGSRISKHDLSEAFQILPVHRSQWPAQAVRILSSYFICLKLCYGDRQAAHRFSRTHEAIIWNLVAPACEIPARSLSMTVDDLIAVSPGFLAQQQLTQFDNEYHKVVTGLGLEEKPDDPTGLKAFRNLSTGDLLGFIVNADNHTWSLAPEKYAKIITKLSEVYNAEDTNAEVTVTLRTAQAAVGKLQALATIQPDLQPWLSFLIRDVTKYIKLHPEANTATHQQRDFRFTIQSRKDLHFLRGLLVATHEAQHWLPLQDPDVLTPLAPDVVIHCDASGRVVINPGEAGPALGVFIPVQPGVIPRAVSFTLPLEFLLSRDDKSQNYHHTTLLEGLSVLSTILRFPNTFAGKTVVFVMDNLVFSRIYNTGKPRHEYVSHLVRCINLAAHRVNSTVVIHWKRRYSTRYCAIADQLTHQDFSSVPAHVTYRRIEQLPPPIHTTLVTSLSHSNNSFHKMWREIMYYWKIR